jgi:hypothetical protein
MSASDVPAARSASPGSSGDEAAPEVKGPSDPQPGGVGATGDPGSVPEPTAADAPPSPDRAANSPRRRLSGVRSTLHNEFKKAPLATAGGLVGLLALIPLASSALHALTDDYIDVKNSPVSFRTGQASVFSMVVPGALEDPDSRPSYVEDPAAFHTWATDRGGVRAEDVELSFVARSDKPEDTLITGVRVVVLDREAPLTGTWFALDAGGDPPNRIIYADLDSTPPTVTRSPGWDYPLSISSDDQEIFTVVASTQECHCRWRAEIDAITPEGEQVTIVVDDDGDPFEVTATSNAGDRIAVD